MRCYIIKGFEPRNSSGGTRALFKLADELKKRGFPADVDKAAHGQFKVNENKENDHSIVVWPELFIDKPIYDNQRTQRMVGWRLGDFGHFKRNEINTVFYYIEMFKDRPEDRQRLFIPIVELELFNMDNLPQKRYNCFWRGKGSDDARKQALGRIGTVREITYDVPNTREWLAETLKGCDILYTVDSNSALLEEARLCGCVVCYIQCKNQSGCAPCSQDTLYGMVGLDGLANDVNEIEKARETLKNYRKCYYNFINNWEADVDNFIQITQRIFK